MGKITLIVFLAFHIYPIYILYIYECVLNSRSVLMTCILPVSIVVYPPIFYLGVPYILHDLLLILVRCFILDMVWSMLLCEYQMIHILLVWYLYPDSFETLPKACACHLWLVQLWTWSNPRCHILRYVSKIIYSL